MSARTHTRKQGMPTVGILWVLAMAQPCLAGETSSSDQSAFKDIHALVQVKVLQVDSLSILGEKVLTRWNNLPRHIVLDSQSAKRTEDIQSDLDNVRLCDGDALFSDSESEGEIEKQGIKVLAMPRLITLIGEPASVIVGRAVSYLKPRADKALEMVTTNDLTEGVEIQINICDLTTPAALDSTEYLGEFDVQIKTVVEREPIAGVPFDVGKPVIKTQAIQVSLRTKAGQDVVIRLPNDADDDSVVFVVIRTTFQPADD